MRGGGLVDIQIWRDKTTSHPVHAPEMKQKLAGIMPVTKQNAPFSNTVVVIRVVVIR
jgi:hypothetical protein